MLDPIYDMTVEPASAAGKFDFAGETTYFCSLHCQKLFQSDPVKYLAAAKARHTSQPTTTRQHQAHHAESTPAVPGAIYTCPMDPEVRRQGSGACPKCGMALEARYVTLTEEENPELDDMTRRFWLGAALSLPVLLVAMSDMVPGQPLHRIASPRDLTWFQFLFSTPVVLWCGWPFFHRAWVSAVNRSPNMFTLIGMGVGTAYLYSLVATLVPDGFPVSLPGVRR